MRKNIKRNLLAGFLALPVLAINPGLAQIDIAGPWGARMHEDQGERGEGPDVGDYTGLPINEAARFRADSWTASKWSVIEHQCEPHPADYAPNFSNMLVTKELHPETFEIVAYQTIMGWMNPTRTIWMDGRAHPPEYAPHTWEGFSTGEWHGDTLVVTTTHLKEGWIRRNGLPRSDQATLTEYWIRNGNNLTLISFIEDPHYLDEPLVRSRNFIQDLGYQMEAYPCSYRDETGMPAEHVPHYLPGSNPYLLEHEEMYGLPSGATRGGAEMMYPEYRDQLQ